MNFGRKQAQNPHNMEKEVEFVVPQERVASLKKNQGRVEELFQVVIRVLLANLVGEGHNSGQQWIRVVAQNSSSLDKAKEYILSLCDPQIRKELRYPPECDQYLRRCCDNIEKESTAVLTFTDHSSVLISGDDYKVMIAYSLIEEELKNVDLKGEDSTDSAAVYSTLSLEDQRFPADCQSPGSASKDSCYNSEDSDGGHDFLRRDTGDQQSAYTYRTHTEQKNSNYECNRYIDNSIKTDGSPKQTDFSENFSKHVDFAAKLGYSEIQVSQVLRQLGPNVDQNDLLHALIKMTKPEPEEKLLAREANPQVQDFAEELSSERDTEDESSNLRPIIIDGSNVAMSHGNKEVFSCRGIAIVVDWFIERNHYDIKVFVPQWRKEASKPDTPITEQEILYKLEKDRIVVWTPSRRINGRRVVCYDDRFIVKTAIDMDGIIVSNDNFRDLQNENPEWKKFIEERLLMYSFVNDTFMPPDDPLGRHGPSLENFLRKNPTVPEPQAPPCPYGKKCTYGNKCKYYHPDRPQFQKSVSEKLQEQAKTRKEVRARGVQRPSTEANAMSTPAGEFKKIVSPQNSGSLGERPKYAHMCKEKSRQGMVPDGGRDPRQENGRLAMAEGRFDPYMEQAQSLNYPQAQHMLEPQYSYKAHTEPLMSPYRRVPPPQPYQPMPITAELPGYRRDMYTNQPRYGDPREDLAADMRQMNIGEQSGYHGNGYVYNGQSSMAPYSRETYRHSPLSRQPSFQQQELYSPQIPHHGYPEYQLDQQGLHPNVSRMRSYPVEGPIPAICEPRPNMTRQNSTSDPQLYQDDVHMRMGRVYQLDGEQNHWRGEQMYSSGHPPSRNGSEPLLVSKAQNQMMRPSSAQALPRPANVGPTPPPKPASDEAPFPPGDPRLHIFYNLRLIFSENDVLDAMKNHPEERDPQKICGYILNKE